MGNIWNYFSKDGKTYWNNKEATLRFYKAVMEGRKFIIYDLETTGIRKGTDRVVEFSAIVAEKIGKYYEITETVEYFIRPPFMMSPEVIAIHGITNEFLENKPFEEEIWPEIWGFFQKHKGAMICGYNVSFDNKFTKEMAARYGEVFDPQENEVVDVFQMVKENIFFDEHEGNRHLSDITRILFPAKEFKFHDSSDDIKATWDVGVEILKRYHASRPVPESAKPKAQIVSYEYKKWGKSQFIFITVKTENAYYDLYYNIYQSCWVNKNDGDPCFDHFDMDDLELKMNEIAKSKGKAKFRLLRDKATYKVS